MLFLLLKHELRDILAGPRFAVVFSISMLLLLTSTIVGSAEYHRGVARHEAQQRSTEQAIRTADNWFGVTNKIHKRPDPLSVFVTGVSFDLPERTEVGPGGGPQPYGSVYSSDVLFAFFRFLDFSFVFQMVVSLLAILSTYDRISGERASGTLKILMSNPIPRVHLVTAKLAGAWIGLAVPLLIVIGICVLLAMQLGVPLGSSDAMRLGSIIATSIIYLSCFIAIGLLVSSLTKDPSVSFLTLLILWAGFALILPRAATEVAGQVIRPMTQAELQSEHIRFAQGRISQLRDEMNELGSQMRDTTLTMSESERAEFLKARQKAWNDKWADIHERMNKDLAENLARLSETRRAEVRRRRHLAEILWRFSPVGSYQLATTALAGTDLNSKDNFEDAVRDYRTIYQRFVVDKQIRHQEFRTSDTERKPVDASEMPRFVQPEVSAGDAIESAVADFGLLVLYTVVAVAGAFVAFLRYDVR